MIASDAYAIREAVPAEYQAIGDLVVRAYRGVDETDETDFDELRDVADRAAVVPVLAAVAAGRARVSEPGQWLFAYAKDVR
jgi:hypothetical protein